MSYKAAVRFVRPCARLVSHSDGDYTIEDGEDEIGSGSSPEEAWEEAADSLDLETCHE
jgi:hypothetical protein